MEEVGFLAKKIISVFLYPLGLSILLLLIGILALLFKKSRRLAILIIGLGTLLLILFSVGATSYYLMKTLENQAGAFQDPKLLEKQGVKYIVVLGGSIVEDGLPPAESWGPSILRVMEGIRLAKGIKDSKLVLSGAAIPGRYSVTTAMSELPLEMGIPRDALILLTTAFDTDEESKVFVRFVRNEPFGLVTSAIHMPRAIKMFKRFQTNPIPCPCDFRTLKEMRYIYEFIPNSRDLDYSRQAIHEYIGMTWMDIAGIFSAIQKAGQL